MNIEALIQKPLAGYRFVKRCRGAFIEYEAVPIGFSGIESWGVPKDEPEIEREDGLSSIEVILSEPHLGTGAEDQGERFSALEAQHEPHATALRAAEDPRGNGGEVGQHIESEIPWESTVNLADVKTRFEAMTPRLKPRTRAEYWKSFRNFALKMELHRYTRKELAGKKGEELLLRYFGLVKDSKPHRLLTITAGIKKVWKRGLDLPWTLESDDLPSAPSPRIIPGPRREPVELWVHAIENEKDPYERSWFVAEFTYGLRAVNQQSALRRQHIVYNEATGKPIGFMVHGADADFKRDSYFIGAIPPRVAEALVEWLKLHPDASPEAYIWPWRSSIDGHVDPTKPMTKKTVEAMRHKFVKRWHLPWLQSKAARKFVKATLIQSGMVDPEKSYWQGHAPRRSDMDFIYGSKQPDEIFAAQLAYLPEGPLGTFSGIKAEMGIPPELAGLWAKVASGDVDSLDAMDQFKAILKAMDRKQSATAFLKP